MPKMKTVKSAVKRISAVSSTGKIMRLKMASQHLARRKSKRARKNAYNNIEISGPDIKKLRRMLPYISKGVK